MREEESRIVPTFFWGVSIRFLWPNGTIAKPWNEGDWFEWAKVDVDRVAEPGCR